MDHAGQVFRNVTVDIDGNSYLDCEFDNVVFRYGGGPVTFTRNMVRRGQFVFVGDFGRALATIHDIAHKGGPEQVEFFANLLANTIRQPLTTV
jgi:hypothetical protein